MIDDKIGSDYHHQQPYNPGRTQEQEQTFMSSDSNYPSHEQQQQNMILPENHLSYDNSNINSSSSSSDFLLHADARSVDRLLASELNSLSFDDREAMIEEMHGVRSLAPSENASMIRASLQDLEREIHELLRDKLLSFGGGFQSPSNTYRYLSGLLFASLAASEANSKPAETGNSSIGQAETQSLPHAHLHACNASPVTPIEAFSLSATTEQQNHHQQQQQHHEYPSFPTLSSQVFTGQYGTSTHPQNVPSDSNLPRYRPSSNTDHGRECDHQKYRYAVSDHFRIKFLRADLFDVPKAAARYVKCIDFLVEYFGEVALERPICLRDLNKEEQKLLREGRAQLMPSRDRFGRRIIAFLGAMGAGHSHTNRFRVVMYLVFQVASDDATTQRNGLVALFHSGGDHQGQQLLDFFKLAVHQNESLRFFAAAPVRYSAFHCFLPTTSGGIGVILNSIGKRTRLITRVHAVSSVTETSYKLRCFGIPPDDFPVTSSGSVKTKKLMKWIKLRLAIEKAREKEEKNQYLSATDSTPPSQFMVTDLSAMLSPSCFIIECPDLDSVIFRNGGVAWDHPANVKFRAILTRREQERSSQKTIAQKSALLDEIVEEAWSIGLNFLFYDEVNEWYKLIRDYAFLRKKVFQALRDQSARRKRGLAGPGSCKRRKKIALCQVGDSSTTLFMNLDNAKSRKQRVSRSAIR